MLTFRDTHIAAKAAAWHDHGHENNPKVPRWSDTRSKSGFNFRMSELQAAVGLAQLRKLEKIIDGQRQSFENYTQAIRRDSKFDASHHPRGQKRLAMHTFSSLARRTRP